MYRFSDFNSLFSSSFPAPDRSGDQRFRRTRPAGTGHTRRRGSGDGPAADGERPHQGDQPAAPPKSRYCVGDQRAK